MIKHLQYTLLVSLAAILTTMVSYVIVTGHDVYTGPGYEFTSIAGETIDNLPCGNPYDTIPQTRGLPLNYNFHNDCEGTQLQLYPFLADILFWFGLFLLGNYLLKVYRRRSDKH